MDEPIVSTSEETTHVNPQLNAAITSPEQKAKLDESITNFYKELDDKADAAPPEAPSAESSQEQKLGEQPAAAPKKSRAERKQAKEKSSPETPIPEVDATPAESQLADDELDSLEPHPQASTQTRGNFRELKNHAKAFRQQAKLWQNNLAPVLQEFGYQVSDDPEELAGQLQEAATHIRGLKNGVLPEPVTKELEELRALAVSVGILRSKAFTDQFVTPRDAAYHNVIDEMAQYFDAPAEQIRKDFIDPLKKDFTPAQLPNEWWQQQTELMTKAPGPVKRKIEQKIANLLLLQEQHDRAANEFAASPKSFHTFEEGKRREADEAFGRAVQARVEATLEKVSPFYFELRKKVLLGDQAAIMEFQPTEDKFRQFLNIVRSGDPNATTDIATQFVEMERRLAGLSDVEAQLKKAKDEIATLRRGETKRRQVADAPMKGGTGRTSTPDKAPLPHSATKSLASAFESWRL
jgi:hypothetical protein